MFKQKQYITLVAVVCAMLLMVMPVSASMVDDGGNNSQVESVEKNHQGSWWQFIHYYFPSYTNDMYQQNEPDVVETPNDQVEEDVVVIEKEDLEDKDGTKLLAFEREVVELTNVEREKYGLQPLKIDNKLSEVAREKSTDMRVNRYFDHNSPVYGSPFDMMKQFGVTYQTAGENIAMGQRSAKEVVVAWMNSEGHRANILNPNFTHIGVGFDENGYYWTQQFIGK